MLPYPGSVMLMLAMVSTLLPNAPAIQHPCLHVCLND
ncbi:hypothetical protein KC19_10G029900 [Ceratodon purpureus]|uniref:Uncharacterized protein n=1 Tax=Ceratodon purpureus TaxID=3225 RepID=A0A8T0GJV4_CERPU|nr:hypothetical protein KC19_10G029900 [Ceratodon purpureus]